MILYKLIREKLDEVPMVKNISVLMSGTVLAQIITIAASPILSRLYSPIEYGTYGIIMAVFTFVTAFSSFKYELAIMIEEVKSNIANIQFLSFLILLSVSLIYLFSVYFFPYDFFNVADELRSQLYFGYGLILLHGTNLIFSYKLNRESKFRILSFAIVINRLSMIGVQILLGESISKEYGLVLGNMSGLLSSSLYLLIKGRFYKKRIEINYGSLDKLMELAKKHYRFPKYSAPKEVLNSFSQLSPVYFIGPYFGLDAVGLYWLAVRIIQLPNTIIGNAFRQVFYTEVEKIKEDPYKLFVLYRKSVKNLFLIGIIPTMIVVILGPLLFKIIFGEQWEFSGRIAQILIIWVFTSLLNPPATTLFNVLNLQKVDLVFNVFQAVLRILVFVIGGAFFSLLETITMFVISGVAINSLIIGYMYIYLKSKLNYESK